MPLHLLVKWEVVSPNSREGQLESISIIYPLFPYSHFVSQIWGWFGGGGVMFFSHFMLFPAFLEKNNLGIHFFLTFEFCLFQSHVQSIHNISHSTLQIYTQPLTGPISDYLQVNIKEGLFLI